MDSVEELKNNNSHNLKLKIGILGTSLFLQAAGSNLAAIPLIMKAFPKVSATNIQALFTIPSFTIMLGILASNAVIKWVGKRMTVIVGMLMALIGGLIPLVSSSYGILVFSRLLVGFGIGLFTSLAVSLLGDCFSGDELKTLIGFQGAMSTLGNSALTWVAGLFLSLGWKTTFLYWVVIIPFLALFMFGYTSKMEKATMVKETPKTENNSASQQRAKIPGLIYATFIMLFMFFAAFMVMSTASALVIQENHLANQGLLSTEIAIAGLIGAVFSAMYSRIFKVFKHFTPVVSVGVAAAGFVVMANASNMVLFFVGLLMADFGVLIIAYVYSTILCDVDPSISNLVISIAQIFNNLGAFASPYVISAIRSVVGAKNYAQSMYISAGILAVITLIFLFMAFSRNKKATIVNA